MDDYDVSNLYESKNEWAARLVNILTPAVIDGIKSIYNEAYKLCSDNDEEEKYLMTFQNLLARVAKWNSSIIDDETKRISNISKCEYLEDLVTCVHIVHLKALTSIRVASKQKKVDIDVPKVSDFIHKVYISVARNVYKNVYLFEKGIAPLQYQKNMRELEVIVKECILNTIREGIPVADILRAYIDETTEEEEIVEENVEIVHPDTEDDEKSTDVSGNEAEGEKENSAVAVSDKVEVSKEDKPVVETVKETAVASVAADVAKEQSKPALPEGMSVQNTATTKLNDSAEQLHQAAEKLNESAETLNVTTVPTPATNSVATAMTPTKEIKVETPVAIISEPTANLVAKPDVKKVSAAAENTAVQSALSFNDTDSVLDMGTNKVDNIEAPKTIERLEKISDVRNEQRKLEEEQYDDDDEDENDTIKIHGDADVALTDLDVHDVGSTLKIADDPILTDIEVLS
tara:strand:+ start:140 stop:1519 length:1380 start_codon:yes stop_codon:yes gene_type:complete